MSSKDTNKTFAFYFDASRCNGCKACQVACLVGRDTGLERNYRRVYEYAGGTAQHNSDGSLSQSAFAYYTSISCNHCDEPACIKACPTGAMHKKENGIVTVHDDICIGCSSCAEACPYDAPQLDAGRGKMTKCDGCYDRQQAGLKPLCVQGCSQRALDCGTVADLQARYGTSAQFSQIAPLPDFSVTKPNLMLRLSPVTKPVDDASGAVLNPNEL